MQHKIIGAAITETGGVTVKVRRENNTEFSVNVVEDDHSGLIVVTAEELTKEGRFVVLPTSKQDFSDPDRGHVANAITYIS